MVVVRIVSSLVLFAVLALCRGAVAGLKVVATTPNLAAIARTVGGPDVEVTSLSLATQDPHFVDAKPSLALALNRADALLVQGLDLEIGWLPTLQVSARNPKIVTGGDGYLDCSSVVPVLEAPTAPVSRAQGDIHRGGNPHYLYDPRNGARVGKAVANLFARLDPERAAAYAKNAADLEKAAADLAAELSSKFAALEPSRRAVVVYHRSFSYLEAWLGLLEAGAVEPKPGIPPDPGHVASLLGAMKQKGVRAIVAESFYPESTIQLLASKTGATLVRVPGGAAEGQGYLDHLRALATALLGALGK